MVKRGLENFKVMCSNIKVTVNLSGEDKPVDSLPSSTDSLFLFFHVLLTFVAHTYFVMSLCPAVSAYSALRVVSFSTFVYLILFAFANSV